MSYLGKISKGSLYTSSGSNYVEQSVGTNDQALVADSAQSSGLNYSTLSGGGSYELISTVTASGVASVEFTDLTSAYSAYEVWFQNTGSASPRLRLRTSTNNGSSYDSGASDYAYVGNHILQSSSRVFASTGASGIIFSLADGSALLGQGEMRLTIFRPSDTVYTTVFWNSKFWLSTIANSYMMGVGRRLSAADVDAIQFTYTDASNITGIFKLYGVSAS